MCPTKGISVSVGCLVSFLVGWVEGCNEESGGRGGGGGSKRGRSHDDERGGNVMN